MSERNWEEEARAEGWVDKGSWKGDPAKHIDAETFVKRGEEILPIVTAKNRKLAEQVEALSHTVEELRQGNAEFKQFTERERDALVRQLEAARKKAVSDGDGEAFDKADKSLTEIRKQPEKKNGELGPVQKAWLADNPWYETNEELQGIADGLSGVLAKRRPDLVGKREFLDKLTEMVKEKVPGAFENPNRSRSTVEDPQNKGAQGKGKALEDMPAEDRAAFEKFQRTIPGFNIEDAVKRYFAD